MDLTKQLLNKELFDFLPRVKEWREAVKKGCTLLERQGVITSDYYDAIIESTEQHGPYYVIAPGIAMPHARPDSGAIASGFSLLVLGEGIPFNHTDFDPVRIVFLLVASDSKTLNQKGIVEIMELIDDSKVMESLFKADNRKKIEKILVDYLDRKGE